VTHPVLLRQLMRLGLEQGGAAPTPEQWAKLLERIDRTYCDADQERYTHERVLDISSREMREVNERLSKAKEAAEAAARAKGDFLAVMSHEIRTPMNGILGMVGVLLSARLSAEQRECAKIVESSAQALLTILDDILHISKIEAGALVLEEIEFELASAVEDVLSLFAETAQSKGLELAGIIDPCLPRRVVGDPARLRQIVSNLVGNAIKFTERGEVVVRLKPGDGDLVRFEIQDSGAGLTNEQIGRIFTPFTQADSSTTRRFGGTGLGLAICKRLVTAMKGTLDVRSEVDVGSTFEFTASLPAGSTAREADGLDRSGRRYLVAENQTASRAALVSRLETTGGTVTCATTSDAVLSLVAAARKRGEPFDVAFVDGRWIKECGVGTLAQLRGLVRVVTVDTWSSHAAANLASDSPDSNDFLAKPVSMRSLLRVLRPHVDSAPAPLPASEMGRTSFRRSMSVLLVEDNTVNQRVAKLQLLKLGIFNVDVAADGLAALERLEAHTYDVVLMDCQMPGMDGFEATRQLRERERTLGWPRVPVIAMTANAMGGDHERCLEMGMDDYLAKPTTLGQLMGVLRAWVPGSFDSVASSSVRTAGE